MTNPIGWCDVTWNPTTGCTPRSPGCDHCWARRMARRLAGRYGYPEAPNEFDVTLRPERLEQPLKWKKPRRVFVCSMSDLFHPLIPLKYIAAIYGIMAATPWHTYLVLTKRPSHIGIFDCLLQELAVGCEIARCWQYAMEYAGLDDFPKWSGARKWPLPNVWLGVTAENQEQADKRIPLLLQTPAAVRFVSVEPMLGPVDLRRYHHHYPPDMRLGVRPKNTPFRYKPIHWIIAGAETGPGARPMELAWARDLRDQCKEAGTPYFFKKATGGVTPDDLMIREFPR